MDALKLKQRIDYIEALSKIQLKIERQWDDHDLVCFRIICYRVEMSGNIEDLWHSRSYEEAKGPLMDAINNINEYIKQQFQPLIDKQKELIRKDI